jgi:hypothetical protein
MDQKFHGDDEKNPRISIFRLGPMANGILSIGNFMLMINKHFALFHLPGNLLKAKQNVLPISVATRNFLFYEMVKHFYSYFCSYTHTEQD